MLHIFLTEMLLFILLFLFKTENDSTDVGLKIQLHERGQEYDILQQLFEKPFVIIINFMYIALFSDSRSLNLGTRVCF